MGAALFPPVGTRGICPAAHAVRYFYRGFIDNAGWSNRKFLVIPLIENRDVVAGIDDICALDEVCVIAFGAGDLAYSMGEGGNMTTSSAIREAYLKVKAPAQRHRVAIMGGPFSTAQKRAAYPRCTMASRSLSRPGRNGFRRFCEDTVLALASTAQGSATSGPEPPAGGFPAR